MTEEYTEETCTACNGSGEGCYDGSTCYNCGGSGTEWIKDDDEYKMIII